MIGCCMAPEPSDLAVFGGRDLPLHPIIAGKSGGHQIVHPVFDPFYRLASDDGGHNRADIARISPNFIAKPASNIGRDHANIMLFNARNQRDHGADRMRRLKRAPKR